MNIILDNCESNCRRYACFLKQQLSITVYRFPSQENKLFRSVFRFLCIHIYIYISIYSYTYCIYKYINTYLHFYIHIYIHTKYIHIYICCRFKQKTEAQAIFHNAFTVCPSSRKLVVGPIVDKETTGSYPSANGRTIQSIRTERTCSFMQSAHARKKYFF